MAKAILSGIFDQGSFTELDRLTDNCEVVTGFGSINGCPCYAFVQDADLNGGAMGAKQASKLIKLYDLAEKTGYPIIGVYDSKGGHIDEGLGAMQAYSSLIAKADRLSGVVPQIAVIKGVCGASSAIWALCSDIVIATKDAQLFLNKSGDDDYVDANRNAQIIADDLAAAIESAKNIICALPSNNLGEAPIADLSGEACTCGCIIARIADAGSVIPLNKGEEYSAKTAFARLGGMSVGMINIDGEIKSKDSKKIISFLGICDAYSIPVITFVNTEGYCNCCHSSLKAAAALTKAYANATTAKITVINGKAYGPAFMTFGGNASGADEVIAITGSVISPIDPEAAMNIVYNKRILDGEDKATLLDEYIKNEASAEKAAANGYISDIVSEDELCAKLRISLDMLLSKRLSTLDKKHTVTIL